MCLLELAAKNEVNGDIAQERTGTVATFGRGAWRSNRAARMAAKGASSPARVRNEASPSKDLTWGNGKQRVVPPCRSVWCFKSLSQVDKPNRVKENTQNDQLALGDVQAILKAIRAFTVPLARHFNGRVTVHDALGRRESAGHAVNFVSISLPNEPMYQRAVEYLDVIQRVKDNNSIALQQAVHRGLKK